MKLVYSALFENCEEGGYSVSFPDLPGCFTEGDDMAEAIEMAQEAACGWILGEIKAGRDVPKPSKRDDIKPVEDSFVNAVVLDMDDYCERHGNKAVKKTLTIPAWINDIAVKTGINFSQVLQDGLKEKLGLV